MADTQINAHPGDSMEVREKDARQTRQDRWLSGSLLVTYVATFKVILMLATTGLFGYGFFIDELYFLACGEHLAWGYVDMPPLTAFQAFVARSLFGDSIYGIRFLPALAGAGLILLTGLIVRQLGGGRWAQLVAAVAVGFSPISLGFCTYLSMNSVEPVIWMGCAAVVIHMIHTQNPKWWLVFGALAGVGMLNKHTMLMFGFALVLGLLLSPARRLLFNYWFILGGVIAFVIFLPNLIWMIDHHFPHLEMLANIRRNGRDVMFNPLMFLLIQVFFGNPFAAPLWIGGIIWVIVADKARPYRFVGYAFIITFIVLQIMHGKVYYLAPAYGMVIAAGAVAGEAWLATRRKGWYAHLYLGLIIVSSAVLTPLFLPLLPPDTEATYLRVLGLDRFAIEHRRTNGLHQLFADRLGWEEMVAAAGRVYNSLPENERAICAIWGDNYGEAGAIDFYGKRYGLPKAISGHLTYWYWGPRQFTGDVVLVLGCHRRADVERDFERVEDVGVIGHPYAMAQEHFTMYLCRGRRGWTMDSIWPRNKSWD